MNILRRSFLIVCTLFLAGKKSGAQELAVVDSVDLKRYAGTWYEIARLPNRFQEDCVANVTATYTLLENGKIKVVNRCRKTSGETSEAEGLARKADENGPNSKLKVRFAPAFLSFLPMVWGDYWIIDLAPDYSYAVVGEPERKYFWILSRSRDMDEFLLNRILVRAGEQGYDTATVMRTKQITDIRE
jgi:apolipoprotein D and lipocalin family protein